MGKTITTHFLEGTPKGIQSIQLSNRTLIAYQIPRSELKKCNDINELSNSCLYILFGENQDDNPKAYIGETDNFLTRVIDHNYNKDFWQKALVFTTLSNTLNKADVLYLEFLALELTQEIKHYDMSENKQQPKKPTLQRHAMDTMNEFFSDVKFITEFVGYDIFKTIEKEPLLLFYTKGKKSDAKGFYDENGFTVLKGSLINATSVKSLANSQKRNELLAKYTDQKDNQLILKQNVTFNSPSTAAQFCLGRSANGWRLWATKEGKTLHEVYRKQVENLPNNGCDFLES